MTEKPDIIVSVDFGTTYTGVAWMTAKTPIQVINDLPGSGDRGERKVPTTLIYNEDGALSSWGFICDDVDDDSVPGKTRRDFFKIYMDEETLVEAQGRGLSNVPQTTVEAQTFARDYLHQIYLHVKDTIETQTGRKHIGGWADMAVTFLFSVPTTWTRLEIINIFKTIIRDAGFGVGGPKHVAQVDLTEAEAAAVATLKMSAVSFNKGSLFLTVDAGGGTTDLALMRVTSSDANCPQMIKGVGIGSTLIDGAFIRIVTERLVANPDIQRQLPIWQKKVYMQPVFKLQMEGVSHGFSHAGLGVEYGRMQFKMEEIQSLFDAQVDGIMKRITEQLDRLTENGYTQQVFCLRPDKISLQLASNPHASAARVAVVPCHDPQLVVVRGLLLDYQQRLETGNVPVLGARVDRSSYGVIVRQLYSSAKHGDEEVIPDLWDPKKKWAINQIQWIIRKVNAPTIDPNVPLVKSFEYRLRPDDPTRIWNADIVVSQNDPSNLPKSLKHAGVTKLCMVKSNLEGVQQDQLMLKQKRGILFRKGYKFYVCRFDLRVIVAPADLRFELWFDGQKFSGNHEPVTPRWAEANQV
ncbi:hypothetical protein J3F83DRAFT_763650 [Trichoderma novae-zelandiae]